jgi:hypothetical protein
MDQNELMLFLSKLLPVFFYPVGATISLLLIGGASALHKCHRLALGSGGAALVVLWLCSTPVFAEWVCSKRSTQRRPAAV